MLVYTIGSKCSLIFVCIKWIYRYKIMVSDNRMNEKKSSLTYMYLIVFYKSGSLRNRSYKEKEKKINLSLYRSNVIIRNLTGKLK